MDGLNPSREGQTAHSNARSKVSDHPYSYNQNSTSITPSGLSQPRSLDVFGQLPPAVLALQAKQPLAGGQRAFRGHRCCLVCLPACLLGAAYCARNSANFSGAFSRFARGSQVSSKAEKPRHLTRNCSWPLTSRLSSRRSTSYSATSSSSCTGSRCRGAPCTGLSYEEWNTG